jgi:hypothetical protein
MNSAFQEEVRDEGKKKKEKSVGEDYRQRIRVHKKRVEKF